MNNANAQKLDLKGNSYLISSFNVSDLIPFDVGEPDLRPNHFQVERDDVIMKRSKDNEDEALEVPVGPITMARTKQL